MDFRTTDWHVEAERACEGKRRFGPRVAREVAADMRRRGDRVHPYLCPWHDPDEVPHWHVGHCPSMAAVERIAAAIRNRANEHHRGDAA